MARSVDWLFTLLVVIGFILLWVKWPRLPSAHPRGHPNPSPRPLKPRTPDDCPACGAAQPIRAPASPPLKSYSQVKDPRGPLREKRIVTAGSACPNPACLYYGITMTRSTPWSAAVATAAKNTSGISSAKPAGQSSASAMARSWTASKPLRVV
jgi:hypothetical protein